MSRYYVYALPLGIILSFSAGGFAYQFQNNLVSISLPPLALSAWLLIFLSTFSFEINTSDSSATIKAPWWRQSLCFLFDFLWLFHLLFIPTTLILLVAHVGHFPPPWLVSDATTSNPSLANSVFFLMFFFFWAGIGLALHPNIRTPGMVLTNIDLRITNSTSAPKIAFFGVFSYYGVFIPLFNIFAIGLETAGHVLPSNKSLNSDAQKSRVS